MLAARRSLLASTAAASGRRSVWWSSVSPLRRWLATVPAGDNDGADNAARLTEAIGKKRETPGQKNAREFALLPKLLQTFEDTTGHQIVPYHFAIPHADASILTEPGNRSTIVFGRATDVHQVPWSDDARGINFGRVLHKFATNPKHQKMHPLVANTLRAMGFPLGEAYRKLAWDQQIMAALKTFYQIYQHSLVPVDFKVPRGDGQWPVATWGFNLGARIHELRTRKHQLSDSELADLESVEFSFNVLETVWSDQMLPSLETYARVYGNCRIPRAFEVPHEDPWPRKAWGLKLGSVVVSLRSSGTYASQVQRDMARLEAIRFVWDDAEYQWSERVLPSLEVFHQAYGHSLVPIYFVVPAESPWPTDAWGFKLGFCVNTIRSHQTFSQKVERDAARLNAIGFVWDVSEHKWTTVILPALETFAQVFGHCNVPKKFVVPSESSWPETAWGLRLGDTVKQLRFKTVYQTQMKRDTSRLEAIGFMRNRSEFKWTEEILPLLEIFFQLYGHARVPTKFIVPSESLWPEKAWGLQLGRVVRSMVRRGSYAEFVDRDADRLAVIEFKIERPVRVSGQATDQDDVDGISSA